MTSKSALSCKLGVSIAGLTNLPFRSAKGALRRLKQNISSDEDINAILKNRVKMMKYDYQSPNPKLRSSVHPLKSDIPQRMASPEWPCR